MLHHAAKHLRNILAHMHVHQQLQDTTITVIVCWADRMEIRFPSLYILEDSHTQQPMDDLNVHSMVGESVQQFSAVDFLTACV